MRPRIQHRPGDLARIQIGKMTFIGVIVSAPNPIKNLQFASVLANGQVVQHKSNQILYSLPKWSENGFKGLLEKKTNEMESSLLLEKTKIIYSHPVTQEMELCMALRRFLSQAEKKELDIARKSQLLKLYKEFTESSIETVAMLDLARKLFNVKEPSFLEVFCLKRLIGDNMYFIDKNNDQPIQIRPLEESTILQSMIHVGSKPGSSLHNFLEKCKMIISSYRKGKFIKIEFEKTDQKYIQLLKKYLESSSANDCVEKKAVMLGIIAKIGLYNTRFAGRDTIIQFLKEIGVFSKNQDPSLHFPISEGKLEHLPLLSSKGDSIYQHSEFHSHNIINIGPHRYPSNSADLLQKKPSSSENHPFSQIAPSSELFSEHSFSKDPLEALRVEFSNPVFVIDSESAHELDDGIAIEETPEGSWIHIHIANPTSYIPSNHPLANISQLRGLSAYLPPFHFPMMPPQLSKHILNLGTSQGTLCFSARLGSTGDIIDYKITPMLVKNPRFISYTKADSILQWDKIAGTNDVESNPPWIKEHLNKSLEKKKNSPCMDLVDNEMKSLLMIQEMMQKHKNFRLSKGAIIYGGLNYSISVKEADMPIATHSPISSFQGESFRTQSTIELNPFAAPHRSPSQIMVQEAMIIAGRLAAKYCQARSLPVSFRGQEHPAQGCMEKYGSKEISDYAEKMVTEALLHVDPVSGSLADHAYQKLIPFQHSAFGSIDSKPHFSMGIEDGYVRTTSPLRRYQDMHTHYQIQSSILGTPLPFSSETTARIIERQDIIQKKTKIFQNISKRYWMLEFLRRQSFQEDKSLIAKDLGFTKNAFRPYNRKEDGKDNLHTAIVIKADYSGKPEVIVSLPYLGGFRGHMVPKDFHICEVGDEITVLVDCVAPDRGFFRLIEI